MGQPFGRINRKGSVPRYHGPGTCPKDRLLYPETVTNLTDSIQPLSGMTHITLRVSPLGHHYRNNLKRSTTSLGAVLSPKSRVILVYRLSKLFVWPQKFCLCTKERRYTKLISLQHHLESKSSLQKTLISHYLDTFKVPSQQQSSNCH